MALPGERLKPHIDHWTPLVAKMLATGKFNEERLRTKGILQRLHCAGRSVILPDAGKRAPREEIFAHVARVKTSDQSWQEVALAFVDKDHEGNGYLGDIIEKLLRDAPADLQFFGITKDPAVMKVFARNGMMPITRVTEPQIELWSEAIGLGERLPDTAKLNEIFDLNRILAESQDPETARRWLFKM